MPLSRRLPKVGFFNLSRVENQVINVRDLEGFDAGAVVDVESLVGAGIARSSGAPVKLLADGELTKALTIQVHGVSGSARKKVEAAGGSIELVAVLKMMQEDRVYPGLNLDNVAPDCQGVSHVREPIRKTLRHVIKNGFAFGGVNASLVCRKL